MDEAEAMVNRILRKASASRPAPSAARLNQPGAWDFFLSHGQAAAGDQVKMLCFMLRQRGKVVWYDNEMANRSTAAMEEGVKHSAHFLIFLSGDPDLSALAPAEGVPPEPQPEPVHEPPTPPTPSTPDPNASLADFLGRSFALLRDDLDALGVEEIGDLPELEDGEVESMAAKLKPVQERKFRKALASLQ